MVISKVQLRDLIANHLKQQNGLIGLLEITLNEMLKNEGNMHHKETFGNKATGYRASENYGHDKPFELLGIGLQ